MHPETVAPSESNLHDAIGTANDASSPRSLRRQVPVSIVQQVLEWSQIEGILKLIDSVEPASTASVGDDVHINVENFGVFGAKTPSNIDPQNTTDTILMQDALTADEACDEEPQHISGKGLDLYNSSPNVSSPEGPQILPSPSHSEAEAAWELCNLHVQQHLETETGAFDPGFDGDHSSDLRDEEPAIEISSSSSTHQPWLVKTVSTKLPRPPVSLISERERFLMHHYMHRVINIFCVIDNAKSPWKTIHLPRAIQGAGELSVMGATSRIRNALRNALLSISAYYFSNVQTSDRRLRTESKWVEAATLYRYDAIGLLKQAVEVDLHSPRRPKYKEFLATMLSMITINVMSGDTSTCGVHLDGAQQLITHMGKGKPRLSSKARALHRIYYYLRVIYESTAPLRDSSCRFSPSSEDDTTDVPQPLSREVASSNIIPDEHTTSPSCGPAQAAHEMASYECIYGIPQSLLVLLQRTIDLIDRVDAARKKHGITPIPSDLERMCDDVEKHIFDWPLDLELSQYRDSNIGTSFDIIYHQTRSFHNALVIYFSQNVRLLSHRYLRQYVADILHDIEAIEAIKTETKLLAAPLFWPAFMAATEAHGQHLQDRFRHWYEKVAVYGIKAVRTGTQVVYEVWKRGPTSDGRITSQWRSVVEETGVTLMLT
ncbi:hypothetical protein CSAL01_05080 [Colletotrichum salicis]|uniref:Uncharacterized protein n=1 Tax=Colletotrichum salicis TaxID=1209931 RepID=A0A135U511_9PEZI|nr:hypothetical protein CSAL01_05080 [Colletotrichum salicis]